ncbi:MAG TPA: COX15/CtaA family protein [Kofleriaceae bacterium]|jgi:cytochrome c oxidase assembly protein subunit 15|nr:COX15/CtaA family protein [Kofleriaceae bacterium]
MLEHRLAKLAAGATFLLLIIGGMVNATGSSLACPEATVICKGSFFPEMTGGVFYEHGHRLAAMTVGLLQIALTVVLLRRRPQMKRLAWIGLGMVIAQGSLGAITVAVKLSPVVSSMHLVLGMSYLATLIYVAFKTAPASFDKARVAHATVDEIARVRRWIFVAAAIVIVQLLIGGLVRHLGAALACLGIPTCTKTGEWFPNVGLQQLQMIHRAVGCLVGVVTTVAAIQVWRSAKSWPALRRLTLIAPVLVATQIVLGVYVILTMRAVPVAVAHFAGAAGLWALWMSMLLMTSPKALASAEQEPIELHTAEVSA